MDTQSILGGIAVGLVGILTFADRAAEPPKPVAVDRGIEATLERIETNLNSHQEFEPRLNNHETRLASLEKSRIEHQGDIEKLDGRVSALETKRNSAGAAKPSDNDTLASRGTGPPIRQAMPAQAPYLAAPIVEVIEGPIVLPAQSTFDAPPAPSTVRRPLRNLFQRNRGSTAGAYCPGGR